MGINVFPAPASGGGGGPLKFVISIGSSGNNGFTLAESVPAGVYSITSELSDSAYDIYFLGKSGQQVGYSSTAEITASDAIYAVSIIGGNTNDVITFERTQTAVPTTAGATPGAGAYITSVSVSNLQDIDDSTVVTGGNFATDVEVYFVGTDDTAREAKAVVRNSSTELVATRPNVFPVSASPYDVQVINPGVTPPTKTGAHILAGAITAGANPVWVTEAGQLSSAYQAGVAYSYQLEATDNDGGSGGLSYAVTAGSLLPGLTLSSSGLISGTVATSGLEATFTVTVTDDGGNTASREFIIAEVAILSGGIEVTTGGYKYHIFKTSGSLSHVGGAKDVEVLVTSGGGGGNGGFSLPSEAGGGAGGGGSNSVTSLTLPSGSHTVTIGAGGAGGNGNPTAGGASELLTSTGFSLSTPGGSQGVVTTGGNGGVPSGGKGGNASGGGANGGSTYINWVNASATGQVSGGLGYYGGGGGGGSSYGSGGGGGLGGGGIGRSGNVGTGPGAGVVNSGGGGGGGNRAEGRNGAAGGSGVVIVRYPA